VIFGWFGKRAQRRAPVDALFGRIAEASRQPALYLEGGIPDSFEGRFESLTLHMFLTLRRLRELPPPAGDLSQELIDGGVSDVAVPKRMKKIGQMYYGRVQAYEAAFAAADDDALVETLRRNASPEGAPGLAVYLRAAQARLAALDVESLLRREPLFPAFASQEAAHDA
jgi:cytochrome b pre-mRNA-processing protein 3